MRLVLRLAHGIMALLFAASALIQFNDPNPFVWIVVYLLAAGASALAALQKNSCARILGIIVGAAGALWEVHYLRLEAWKVPFFDLTQEWHMTSESIVNGREFYALIWIVVWMLVVVMTAYNRTPAPAD